MLCRFFDSLGPGPCCFAERSLAQSETDLHQHLLGGHLELNHKSNKVINNSGNAEQCCNAKNSADDDNDNHDDHHHHHQHSTVCRGNFRLCWFWIF